MGTTIVEIHERGTGGTILDLTSPAARLLASERNTSLRPLAEIEGKSVNLGTIDLAHDKLERDKHVAMIKNCPKQLQAALYAILHGAQMKSNSSDEKKTQYTGDAYGRYRSLCERIRMRALTQRAFSDMVSELDIYSFIRTRVFSRGRYGRYREILVELSSSVIDNTTK